MALVDNFDSYNNGDLNGQGDWSGHINFDVQGTITQDSSTKAVVATADGTNRTISKSFTGKANGSQVFYMRTNATNSAGGGAWGSDSNGWEGNFHFRNDGDIRLYAGGSYQLVMSDYLVNTWYKCELEWRVSDHKVRARVNDGAWTDWYASVTDDWTVVEIMTLNTTNIGTGTFYFDSFSEPSAAGPADVKSVNEVAVADIKSINGVAIADVKSVNAIT